MSEVCQMEEEVVGGRKDGGRGRGRRRTKEEEEGGNGRGGSSIR